MRTASTIALLAALAVLPAAAYAAEVQFHIITESGNTFLIEPPNLPRPANIIGETAHLAVRNPPAGMFVATSADGAAHKFTPLQSGLDTDGFAGGTVRVILRDDWDRAGDREFRDQAFGTMSGDPMRHSRAMPLAPSWNDTYDLVPLRDDSCFGLGTCTNNTLGLAMGSHGEYTVPMGSRERAGLDFGPGTGADHTYYIYRGCSPCGALAAVGHGDPADRHEALPNDLSVTDHHRGWRSTGSCGVSETDSWNGRGSRTVSDTYAIPSPAHSRAGGHYIDSRYADLSVLPGSHSSCSGTMYTENSDDNRKHDMCVSGTSASASTTHRYPYTQTVRTDTIVSGSVVSTTTTTTSGSTTRTTTGSCGTPSLSGIADGYRVSASCSGGPSPSNPPRDSTSHTSTGDLNAGTITTTTRDYSGPSVTTTGTVRASCSLHTNTPHLDLDDTMALRPGLNLYRPGAIPTNHNILAIYDDAENGGGGNERIQVFRHGGPGPGPDPAGPYSFHLRPNAQGILYDAHRHYGWVDARSYDAGQLSGMGYTAHSAMAGHGDGLRMDGSGPSDGTRICHGDCFMGMEGIDSGKPAIREVAASSSHAVFPGAGLTYDHRNDMWFTRAGGGDRATAAALYLVVPFAEDAALYHIRLYDHRFDPAAQLPSPRDNPGGGADVCHIRQSGGLTTFAARLNVTDGDALHIPVLPGMRYAAFVANGDCYWYDATSLPSPLSSVASGARHVPLVNGTVLSGDLTARRDGMVHVDVVADLVAAWQSEAYGIGDGTVPANASWAVPPLEVEVTAVARVNGAYGPCGASGVYCSEPILMAGTTFQHGAYIHGTAFRHGEPYAEAPRPLPSGTAGTGVYGLPDGRCYGLEGVSAATGGLEVRDIPRIRVTAGDTITLSFNATVSLPEVAGGNVTMAAPAGHACRLVESVQTATLDIRTMTATLR